MTQLNLDPWSFLDYKSGYGGSVAGGSAMAPRWVGMHSRRLEAYKVLESYFRNSSRYWTLLEDEVKKERREFGDPNVIVQQQVSSVLGEQGMTIHVDGAELQPRDENQADDAAVASTPADQQLQMLRKWAEDEGLELKQYEVERMAGRLGDGVMVLGWDSRKQRPVVNTYDPGFYFPVWNEDGADAEGMNQEFPDKVHIAYEFDKELSDGRKERWVRRITWELAELDGDRNYPWNDAPSTVTCLMSDGSWKLTDDIKRWDDFDTRKATWRVNADGEEINELDLEIDFIPVIHIPNISDDGDSWGISSLSVVLQIIDELISTDTDLSRASALAGFPPIALDGTLPKDEQGRVLSYGPGTTWELSQGGKVSVVDTSSGINALLDRVNHLLERLSINSRTPESILGRVKPSEVPSGIALWLTFAPHSGMIREMRAIRKRKYELMLKFVSRWMLVNGDIGAISRPRVAFGSYLPADQKEAIDMVVQAMNAGKRPMSLRTGIMTLQNAGLPIDDVATELQRIQREDYSGANDLLNATGDPQAARDYLGLTGPALGDELTNEFFGMGVAEDDAEF